MFQRRTEESALNTQNPTDWEESDLVDVCLEDQHSRCYFCLDDYAPPRRKSMQNAASKPEVGPEPLRQFPCGHVAHKFCADHWMRENRRCFLCKQWLYPAEAVRKGDNWLVLFNDTRTQDGTIRRPLDVALSQSHEFTGYDYYRSHSTAGGRYWVVCMTDHSIRLLDVPTASEIFRRDMEDEEWSCYSTDRDASCVVIGDGDAPQIWTWNVGQYSKQTLVGHRRPLVDLGISGDGRIIASVSKDKTMRIWDRASGSLVRKVKLHHKPSEPVSLSMDGRVAAAALTNGEVLVCATKTGVTLKCLSYGGNDCTSIAFTPDGAGMLTGDEAGSLKYWDIEAVFAPQERGGGIASLINRALGPRVKKLRHARTFRGHGSCDITAIDVSPDGCWVASCTDEGAVYLWDFETTEIRCVLQAHDDHQLSSVDFSLADSLLGTCDDEGYIRIWKYTVNEDGPRESVQSMPAPAPASDGPSSAQAEESADGSIEGTTSEPPQERTVSSPDPQIDSLERTAEPSARRRTRMSARFQRLFSSVLPGESTSQH